MKKVFSRIILLLLISLCFIYGCNNKISEKHYDDETVAINNNYDLKNDNLLITDIPIYHDEKFGGIIFHEKIEELKKNGYMYGDSVNIEFSNGYKINDIPYYNGYFVKSGEKIFVGYPTEEYPNVSICNGEDLWEISNLTGNDTAKISRNEKGKYLRIHNLFNLNRSNNREDYNSDEAFANFRNIKVGNIKENMLYRGASPCELAGNRGQYVDKFIEKVGINFNINLSDDKDILEKYFSSQTLENIYYKTIYDNGKVIFLNMGMNFKSGKFAKDIVNGFMAMSKNEGPYYINCQEGKDRTGIFCAVLEGLAGASYEEIVFDYMLSFENYFGVNKNTNKERYNVIKENLIDDFLRFFANYNNSGNENIELKDLEWKNIMGRYLLDNGMGIEDLDNLYSHILNKK